MTLRAHHDLKLIYPKIHCRISRNSRQDYLDAINRDFLSGRNVISFLNDDGLIPAQVKAGKHLEDARRYVAGGCWEMIIEGCEHSAGANCYFNLARIMDMSIHRHPDIEAETGYSCDNIYGCGDFEEVYRIVMDNVIRIIRRMCAIKGKNGSVWPQVSPAPFFSACLSDCLKNRKDYTAGGGRYNPHGVPLTNFAVFVDSLLVIRKLCFETKRHTLKELLDAVKANWEGCEILRAEVLTMPHFGDNSKESNELARRVLDEIYVHTRDLKNERGGPFQLGIYSYRDVIDWAKITCATPDGRRAGDFLAQGLTPSRLHHSAEITSVINSGAALDLSKYPANSVMTLSLPLNGIRSQTLAQIERAFAASGIGMLQMNCVDKAQLLDARKRPEQHQDLIVRLYGYSARFVNLTPEMQEEFINRNIYEKST
jgi:formate C-acetyltransferase